MDDEKLENPESEESEKAEDKSGISADLIRGHINTIILRTLYERDKYGYEIIEEIETKSKGQYSLKQPTLYSALKRLESQGFINAYWKTDEVSQGGRRKYYTLTDSGRAITEKNQAEWEYSRTVIDNLISDRSFDFSNPAPTAVDFKILKNSTTRVHGGKKEDDEDDEDEKEETEKQEEKKTNPVNEEFLTLVQDTIITDSGVASVDMQYSNTVVSELTEADKKQKVEEPEEVKPVQNEPAPPPVAQTQPAEVAPEERNIYREQLSPAPEFGRQPARQSEEQRRILHENYLKLISQPVEPPPEETPQTPFADKIDTEKLIYNNKPEPERDYKNLINNIFERTVTKTPEPKRSDFNSPTPHYYDATAQALNDGLSVNTSNNVIESKYKKTYNRGKALFTSSCIVFVIMLLEFALCLIFKDKLGVNGVGYAYPFVILSIGLAQLLIFFILRTLDTGKSARKPVTHTYLTASIIISVILILIVCVLSVLINVNFSAAGDIMAKIVIPSIIVLNIPIFSLIFYFMSK